MFESIFIIKFIGAFIGSSVAVLFSHDKNSKYEIIKRLSIGILFGYISSPIIIDYISDKHTLDYWLASSSGGGIIGYISIEFILSREFLKKIKTNIEK